MTTSCFRKLRRLVPLPLRVELLGLLRMLRDIASADIFCTRDAGGREFPFRLFTHGANLFRQYPEPWFSLQEKKVSNLARALPRLDGVVVGPGEVFSFWRLVGRPDRRRGFVPGMTVSGGGLALTTGGGLCQVSNALYWTALNLGFEIIERHRHSLDVFPDSGREVPFAAGATVAYRAVDLRFRNPHPYGIRLSLFMDDKRLHILADADTEPVDTYQVYELNHRFTSEDGTVWRSNELWQSTCREGVEISRRCVVMNRGRVLYGIAPDEKEASNG